MYDLQSVPEKDFQTRTEPSKRTDTIWGEPVVKETDLALVGSDNLPISHCSKTESLLASTCVAVKSCMGNLSRSSPSSLAL